MVVRKYEHSVVRGVISFTQMLVELAPFLSQILCGDVGPCRFRSWPPGFMFGHPIL